MKRVLPKVRQIAEAHPAQTIFTRFIPPAAPNEMPGMWQTFYERWREITELDPSMLDLVPPLQKNAPPALVLDKRFLSPFQSTRLAAELERRRADTLVITGAETDMCVLAAVLDAVDLGYRVILPEDAICSSSDEMHDALLKLYRKRFSIQIETATTAEVLALWQRNA